MKLGLLLFALLTADIDMAQFFAIPSSKAVLTGVAGRAIYVALGDFVNRYCSKNVACLADYRVTVRPEADNLSVDILAGRRPPHTAAEARHSTFVIGRSVDYKISRTGKIVDRYVEE